MEGKRNINSFQSNIDQPCAFSAENGTQPPNKLRKVSETKVNPIVIGQVTNSQDVKIDYNSVDLVTVPRDLLLTFTRQDLDTFIQQVTQGRKLTKEQRQEVSRQRKLIKNRKSAAASRKRKKEQLGTLEEHHAVLSDKNSQLKEKFAALRSTNSAIKDELNFLKNLVHLNPGISTFFRNIQSARKQYENASVAMKQAATILLIIILSLNFIISSGFLTANNFEKMSIPSRNPIQFTKPTPSELIAEPVPPIRPSTSSILDSMSSTHDQNGNYVPTLLPDRSTRSYSSMRMNEESKRESDSLSFPPPSETSPTTPLSPSSNPNYKEDLAEIFPGLFDDAELELLSSTSIPSENTNSTTVTVPPPMEVEITPIETANVLDPITLLLLDLVHTPHPQCELNPSASS